MLAWRGAKGSQGGGAYGTCRVQRVAGHEDVRLEERGGSARIVRIFIKESLAPPTPLQTDTTISVSLWRWCIEKENVIGPEI